MPQTEGLSGRSCGIPESARNGRPQSARRQDHGLQPVRKATFLVLLAPAIVVFLLTDVPLAVSLASRVFATYFGFQAVIAWILARRVGNWAAVGGFILVALAMGTIAIFGLPLWRATAQRARYRPTGRVGSWITLVHLASALRAGNRDGEESRTGTDGVTDSRRLARGHARKEEIWKARS